MENGCFDGKVSGVILTLNEDVSPWSKLCSYGKLKFSKYYISLVKE